MSPVYNTKDKIMQLNLQRIRKPSFIEVCPQKLIQLQIVVKGDLVQKIFP